MNALNGLQSTLDGFCQDFKGEIGYCLKLLGTGESISCNGDFVFPTASTIKTAIMVEAFNRIDEGTLSMNQKVKVPPQDGRELSMWAYFMRDGVELDIDGMVNLLITVSDNTATIMCRNFLGTMNINRRMESLGLKNTKILGNAPPEHPEIRDLNKKYGMGMTTPNEMNRLLELIYIHEAASYAACERMERILSHQYWDDAIGSSVPPRVQVGSKSGALDDFRADAAIVYCDTPYVLTVYTHDFEDRRWQWENEGSAAIRWIASEVWKAISPHDPYELPTNYAKFLPTGGGVDEEVF